MLDAVPELRSALARYDEAELADLLSDFDVTATYDKRMSSMAGGRYGPVGDPTAVVEWVIHQEL